MVWWVSWQAGSGAPTSVHLESAGSCCPMRTAIAKVVGVAAVGIALGWTATLAVGCQAEA